MSPERMVLVIDDDAGCREALAQVLELNGWNVLQAGDGERGLELARTHAPEVVIVDLLMTPMNGFQFCKSLRAVEFLRHTRIIVISARDFESDRQASLEAGADEFLSKPLRADQVVVMLSRFSAERGGAAGTAGVDRAATGHGGQHRGMLLRFWGVRGSIPTPGASTVKYGGNTSCLEVRAGDEIIVLDAGTGMRPLGRALLEEFGSKPLEMTLLLTHTHWDHIQGLPFFRPVYEPHHHLRILGYEGARDGLANVLAGQMESPVFPIGLREVPANVRIEELKDFDFKIGRVQVNARFAYHPGICVGYRLSYQGCSIAFFPDNELRSPPAAAGADPARAQFVRDEHRKLIDFLHHTDVLVMDAQYDTEEYGQHVGWGHGCLDHVVQLAIDAGVRELFLFHHDPDHSDEKVAQMVAHGKKLASRAGSRLKVEAAREGLAVELQPR